MKYSANSKKTQLGPGPQLPTTDNYFISTHQYSSNMFAFIRFQNHPHLLLPIVCWITSRTATIHSLASKFTIAVWAVCICCCKSVCWPMSFCRSLSVSSLLCSRHQRYASGEISFRPTHTGRDEHIFWLGVILSSQATVNVWADNQYQSYIRSNVSELDYCNPAITKNWNVSFPGGFEIHDFQCVRRDSSQVRISEGFLSWFAATYYMISIQVVYLAPNEIDVMTFIAEQDTVNGSITGDMRPRFVIDAEYVKWNFGVAWSTSFANSHMVNMEILDADDHRFRQSDDGAFFVCDNFFLDCCIACA